MSDHAGKRCFVISPIGAEGSKVREHADDVYDYIIKPAMDACGVTAFRSDHLRDPGKISEQMFRSLIHDDLVVAVLTGHNPNVFYELAIAQAAARPVIILLRKGQALPFDIQDLRCVYYDLKPRPLFEKVYVNEIIAHVRKFEAAAWEAPALFGVHPPLGGSGDALDAPHYFPRAEDFGGVDVWLELVQQTRQTFEMMGVTLRLLRFIRGVSDALVEKANAGCSVRILLMHPDNPALREIINEAVPADTGDATIQDIGTTLRLVERMRDKSPSIEVRQMLRGCPHFHLTRTDSVAIVTQNLFATTLRYSPLWHATARSSFYTTVAQEFEALWVANSAREKTAKGTSRRAKLTRTADGPCPSS
jgi:hypothetical protein